MPAPITTTGKSASVLGRDVVDQSTRRASAPSSSISSSIIGTYSSGDLLADEEVHHLVDQLGRRVGGSTHPPSR